MVMMVALRIGGGKRETRRRLERVDEVAALELVAAVGFAQRLGLIAHQLPSVHGDCDAALGRRVGGGLFRFGVRFGGAFGAGLGSVFCVSRRRQQEA